MNFKVINDNGNTTLKYESGKVGFISLPASKLFDRIHDNNYITVNKQNETITINPKAIEGQTIDGITVNSSNLNIILNKLNNEK